MNNKVTKKQVRKFLQYNNFKKIKDSELFSFCIKAGNIKEKNDDDKRDKIRAFIEKYSPSKKVKDRAFHRVYDATPRVRAIFEDAYRKRGVGYFIQNDNDYHDKLVVKRMVKGMKYYKKVIRDKKTNYSKVLITGMNNIYWACDAYGHSDYNKRKVGDMNFNNLRAASIVNNILQKEASKIGLKFDNDLLC